jgi:hypothetical protein
MWKDVAGRVVEIMSGGTPSRKKRILDKWRYTIE